MMAAANRNLGSIYTERFGSFSNPHEGPGWYIPSVMTAIVDDGSIIILSISAQCTGTETFSEISNTLREGLAIANDIKDFADIVKSLRRGRSLGGLAALIILAVVRLLPLLSNLKPFGRGNGI